MAKGRSGGGKGKRKVGGKPNPNWPNKTGGQSGKGRQNRPQSR